MTQDLDLDVIDARLAAATPGPWRVELARTLLWITSAVRAVVSLSIAPPRVTEREIREEHVRRARADADLIANAPEDLRALVAEVRRLRAERVEACAIGAIGASALERFPCTACPNFVPINGRGNGWACHAIDASADWIDRRPAR